MGRGRIKVLHLISGLQTGGAEMMLFKLLRRLNRDRCESAVVSVSDEGILGERIRALGVPLYGLGLAPAGLSIAGLWRLGKVVLHRRPDILQGWMYHGDLMAAVARMWIPRARVVWNVRTDANEGVLRLRTRQVLRACCLLSRWVPDVVLFNSERSLANHRRKGYRCRHMRVIPNGFELSEFRPDELSRSRLRESLGLPPSTELVGMAAHYALRKDYPVFLAAAAIIARRRPGVRFVACGRGVSLENPELASEVHRRGLQGKVLLLGERRDMPRFLAGLDVFCLASRSEGFPNVVGEAMACGVPVVATDVGDCRPIVGDTGLIVPPGDAEALARGCLSLLEAGLQERQRVGLRARRRVAELYDIDRVARQYEILYEELGRSERSDPEKSAAEGVTCAESAAS